MGHKGSLPHSQGPAICSCHEPDRSSSCPYPTSLRSILILSCHRRPGLPMASSSQLSSPNPCIGCAKVSVRFRRFCKCFVTVSFVSAPDFSTCSVVCIVTRLRGRPCRESKRPNRPWKPPSLLFSGFQVLFSPG